MSTQPQTDGASGEDPPPEKTAGSLAEIIRSATVSDVVAESNAPAPPPQVIALRRDHEVDMLGERYKRAKDDRRLRKKIALCVGCALAIEILLLFLLVYWQGGGRLTLKGHLHHFQLEEWTFGVFTSAVLLQTFALARLVVRNLFPSTETGKEEGA